MSKNTGIYLRLSNAELDAINDAWISMIQRSGRPVSRSEFIRIMIGSYIFKYKADVEKFEDREV